MARGLHETRSQLAWARGAAPLTEDDALDALRAVGADDTLLCNRPFVLHRNGRPAIDHDASATRQGLSRSVLAASGRTLCWLQVSGSVRSASCAARRPDGWQRASSVIARRPAIRGFSRRQARRGNEPHRARAASDLVEMVGQTQHGARHEGPARNALQPLAGGADAAVAVGSAMAPLRRPPTAATLTPTITSPPLLAQPRPRI